MDLTSRSRESQAQDGRVLGKMAHSERDATFLVAINIYGEQDMKVFESGVEYFK